MKIEAMPAEKAARAGGRPGSEALQHRLAVAFVGALVVVTTLSLTVFETARRALASSRLVAPAHEVLQVMNGVEGALVTAQSAVRGFVITGDEVYLRDRDNALSSLESRVQRLRDLAAGNDSQRRRWQALRDRPHSRSHRGNGAGGGAAARRADAGGGTGQRLRRRLGHRACGPFRADVHVRLSRHPPPGRAGLQAERGAAQPHRGSGSGQPGARGLQLLRVPRPPVAAARDRRFFEDAHRGLRRTAGRRGQAPPRRGSREQPENGAAHRRPARILASRQEAARLLRHRHDGARGRGLPGAAHGRPGGLARVRSRSAAERLGRCRDAAAGPGESPLECAQVRSQGPRPAHRSPGLGRGRPERLLREGRRRRLRHGVLPQAVRRVSAPAFGRVPRHRGRARHRSADRDPPRRQGLGREQAGRRIVFLFFAAEGGNKWFYRSARRKGRPKMNRSRNILLVEDNPYDVELTLRAFEQSNIMNELVVVRDGKEALDYLFGAGAYAGRDLGDAPEVVLLDLKLPKVDGLEVLRRMRADERTRRQPVVVLTSSSEEKDVVSCYNLCANSFVRKPVDFTQFTEAAKQLGLYWLVLNEPPP